MTSSTQAAVRIEAVRGINAQLRECAATLNSARHTPPAVPEVGPSTAHVARALAGLTGVLGSFAGAIGATGNAAMGCAEAYADVGESAGTTLRGARP
ncbi:hypothetical protein [Pseudonocardia nigra]|uniref:hypothetical protein n=1 Tax=Pseudonocardia nigra TaxID=1921578 RepID=UPI001C5DB2F9|nr:hypothetical protein [Pseudonocardia nigra]